MIDTCKKLGVEEFKLNFYFNKYKDKSLPNRDDFRRIFKKTHGGFQYLEELILMIEKYQIKKYGRTLPDGGFYVKGTSRKENRISRKLKYY